MTVVKYVKIGDVFETTSGGTPLRNHKEYYLNGSIPWIKSGEVAQGEVFESEEHITELGLKNSSAKILPINTVLLAMYGATAGKVGILKKEATTNQAVCGILPNEKAIARYLFWVLKSQYKKLIGLSAGGAQPNISQKIIRNLEIPLPSLEEQRRTVLMLDQADSLRQKRQKAISLLDDYLKAVFLEMFADPHNNIHDFSIGTIGDLVCEVKYGTSKKAEEKGEYIYLRMNNGTPAK